MRCVRTAQTTIPICMQNTTNTSSLNIISSAFLRFCSVERTNRPEAILNATDAHQFFAC